MADSVSAAVQQPAFDVAGARKAGYSDGEIASYLAGQSHFDLDGAKQAGYNDNEIVGFLSHPTVAYTKPETKPEDTFLGSVGKGITSIPAAFERTAGGALRAAGENTPEPNIPLTGQESEDLEKGPLGEAIKASAGTPGTPAHIGKEIFDAASQHLKENAPNVPAGSIRDYAYKVTLGLGELVPIVAATMATKSPLLGAAAIAGQAGSEKYGEARETGRTIDQATADAGFTGLVNGAMAMLPLGAVMKPGASFLGKAASVAGANAFMGVATEALQMGYDKGILHQDMPLGEAITRIKDAGIVGAVTGALLGAGEHGLSRLTGGGEPPEPAPQAPTPEQKAAPVLSAPTVDAAIQAAQAAVHAEPIDIEAMGRTAQMQAAAAGQGERGVNDLLSDLDMQEGQIEQEAGAPAPAPVDAQQHPVSAPPSTEQPRAGIPAETLEKPAEQGEIPPLAARDASIPSAAVDTTPSLADTTEMQGRVRGAPRRVTTGPVDAATFLAMNGGIRNDEGHDLTAGRGLQQFVPGVGPLIRPSGMSMDYAGEALHEAGYFGPPESTPRPTENEVLQFLERTGRVASSVDVANGRAGLPTKVYTPEDQARLDQAAEAKRAEADNARALQDIHDEARAMGESLEPHEAEQVTAYMGEHGLNPEAAVGEFLERKYSRLAEEYHEQTGDSAYAEASPVTRGQGEIDLGHGEGLEGQEAVPFPEGGSGEGRDAVAPDTEPARELSTERGAAGLDQTIIPGAEASARQLAQAREDAGHGRIQPRAQQKPADNGLFGDKPEPTLFARRNEEPAPPFFSALTRAVEGVKMEKAPPGQWEATIKNLPGVKAEEADWSGVNDWLRRQTRSVTKAEVLQHLRENEVQVNEVEKGRLNDRAPDAHLLYGTPKDMTKYGSYTLPGGSNYRELLLTLPGKPDNIKELAYRANQTGDLKDIRALEAAKAARANTQYKSSHWDEPNILAHVRFDDRTGPNGEKVLHIAEVQSDWHQQGRRKGYALPEARRAQLDARRAELEKIGGDLRGEGKDIPAEVKQEWTEVMNELQPHNPNKVPDAPFKTSWHELAMKRMLRYAAEHGYDRLSWDTGDTNAERYDLSKQVDRITAERDKSGDFTIRMFRDGKEIGNDSGPAEKLPDIVGKDLAQKIVDDIKSPGGKTYSGLDLKVGGEGMKGFYDKILPTFLNKYAKKWGAKVEQSTVNSVEKKLMRDDAVDAPAHSIAITPAMREGVMQGQPLFARREGEVTGTFSPEFDVKRAEVAADLRKRLDELGLHDIALKLPDAIETPEGLQDGAFRDKIIAVALDAKDHGGVLDHEAIHALRAMDLFKKSEWSILAGKAAREWRARYKIDERYGDFPEDRRNEEAVAEAFRYWVKGKGNQTGIVARLFDKMRNALSAVGNALKLRGFQTADSIFGKIDRGEVGARPGHPANPEAAVFARRNPPTEDEIYRDGVSDLISAASEGEGTTNLGARLLTKISEAGIKQLKNPNIIESEALLGGTLFPRTMASLDDMSARLWRPWMAREEETHANVESLRRVVSKSLVSLSSESRDRVYAALELARKWEWRPPDDGRPIRVRNTSYWQAQKSKVGDDYVLNPTETRAFHDALKLGDEGWRMFMSGLAKREGWNGPVDASMIRAAANHAGEGLPEGKRLLRLASAIETAQAAINRPYFPAMRFGDYFIAVKPKIGTEENSLGGYPKVEWFETVEKPQLADMLGKSRLPAADTPGVKEALDRIKARTKADGSLAFTDETHDFEIGDLRTKTNILKQLNLPAIEKLFMLMERGVTNDLRDKIMATNTPEGGATGKEAAGIKQEAGEAAKAHYEATLGETKDILLDAVYHDLLLSGWKKQAQMTPGYSADFDRAISTHMYQVGRNSADLVYRNSIEDAYQNIQDNHPHISARQYWQHWRAYQENPQNAWARAAGKTAQIGAAYVMGLNPSTTMMIAAHTPIMATPVLGVGGGMGQATVQMSRAIREVYKALSFDKKKGGFIDTDQIGRTPREKALIAELDRTGLNHSLGADDVRNINDRQAGLWGSAQPTMKKALDIAMSNVSAVDQANRNAIALAAHRMAMNPATLEKMAAPWMEHNAIFRQMVMDEGLTPEGFTKFMMSEAAGAWGRTNQAPMMRGLEGSLLFALHGFQTRFLSTAYKLMVNMGPAGKVAAGWMMAALWAGTGIYGLPFTQDLENAGGMLWKSLTGVDPMIDAHIRQFLQDAGLGKIGTEILLRGPLSVMTGIDLESRLGFGDVITRSASATDLLGTIPSIFFGKLVMAYNRERTGQGLGAAGAELLPAALRNPARAAIESEQGQQSQQGAQQLTPDQITTSHTILRSLGLPPLASAQAQDRAEYMRDLTKRDEDLRHQTEESAANLILQAGRADREGDAALAHELSEQVGSLLGDYNRDHWQAPVTQEGLSDAILQHTNPEIYRLKKTPGRLRGEAYRNLY